MKYFTFLFIISFLVFTNFFAQEKIDNYTLGMKDFNLSNYSSAVNYFEKFINEDEVDAELLSSAKIYLAESLLGINQKDGAITQFENFINQYPTSNFRDLALYRLGNLYFEKKLYEKSRTNLVELVRSFPSSDYSGSAYHLIGESFIEENDLDKAEEFFNSAVDSKRNNTFVDHSIYSLANLYEKKGQFNDAVKYYDKLLGYHKESDLAAQAQMRIGICYFELKEYDNTVLELSDPLIQELEIDQQNEAEYILANAFYSLREYDKATAAYKRILNNSPNSEMLDRIRYGLSWIHFHQGNYNDAYKMFNLLSQSSDDSIALKSLYWSGESKRYDGKYGEAIEIHKNFAEQYPNHPYTEKVKLNIGISKFSQNSYKESEESLLESLNSTDPLTKAKSYTLLGEINLEKKQYNGALEYFKRGLQIPQIPNELKDRCHLGLGVANFFAKNNVNALNSLKLISEESTTIEKDKLNFYKAEASFYMGNFNDAITFYNKVSEQPDNLINKNVIYGKAYSYFNQRDFQRASYFFNEFLKQFKNDEKYSECELRLADCYYGSKSFEKASQFYERVLVNSRKFSNDDRSYFNYAQSLFKQGSSSKSINVLSEFQIKFPASEYADDSQYLIGWINFQNGKFDEAINGYEKLFSNYPQSALLPIAYYSIGDSYFNKGDYSQAVESYNRLIKQYPKSSYVFDAVNGIQYCYVVQDKLDEAINYLNSFIIQNPNLDFNDKIQFKKGEIYYSTGNYKSAIIEYKKLIDNYSNSQLNSSAYYWMGKSAILLNDQGNAIKYFKEVIDHSLNTEDGFNSILELGKIYRKQKNFDRELTLYDESLNKITDEKRISEIKFVKAQNFIENNNIPQAYQTLGEIVDKRDGSLFYYKAEIELGALELARSNYDNSLFLFGDVIKNRTDDIAAQAQLYIGQTYFNQEKMPEAITELKKVVTLYSAYDEWYSPALMLLGDSYIKINDKSSAAEMYKSVLKRHRNDALAKEAKEKLEKI